MAIIGVCDDSPEYAERIAEAVKASLIELGSDVRVEEYTSGEEIIRKNRETPFDALFLDIDMPGTNGFDIAREIRTGLYDCPIVFVTSHSELVFDSFDFQPFNFIRKNSAVSLEESVRRIAGKLIFRLRLSETAKVTDRSLGEIAVRIKDIICMEASGHYLIYTVLGNENGLRRIISRETVTGCLEKYESRGFARVHKGFIVNLYHVLYINTGKREIGLTGGTAIPIGKLYLREITEKYSFYLRRKS